MGVIMAVSSNVPPLLLLPFPLPLGKIHALIQDVN